MAIDRYRMLAENRETQKQTLLDRVMEQQQVDPTQLDEYDRIASGNSYQNERVPDWFAD